MLISIENRTCDFPVGPDPLSLPLDLHMEKTWYQALNLECVSRNYFLISRIKHSVCCGYQYS